MPCHAVRIIKRNYCRPVVNNALLLKRVPATAARIPRAVSIVPENRAHGIQTRSSLPFATIRFSAIDLDLTLLSAGGPTRHAHAGISCAKLATWHLRLAAISRLPKAAKNHIFGAFDRGICANPRCFANVGLAQLSALRDSRQGYFCAN